MVAVPSILSPFPVPTVEITSSLVNSENPPYSASPGRQQGACEGEMQSLPLACTFVIRCFPPCFVAGTGTTKYVGIAWAA